MLALRLTHAGLELDDIPEPEPGDGEVLVAVKAAGLCHSDLVVASRPVADLGFELPTVLGHELAGTVVATGRRVAEWREGDAVVGYGPRGCGTCSRCAVGADNYCRSRSRRSRPTGLGSPGALAELVVVPASSLVGAEGVEPTQAAALTDAGLTALHAVRRARGSTESLHVVIGVGGLGHLAVQLLASIGPVLAVDLHDEKLKLARQLGATSAVRPDEAVQAVADLGRGRGADAVLDFVSSDQSLPLAASLLAVDGVLSIVGVGAARLPVGMHAVPLGTRVDTPFWGTRPELVEVLDLHRRGQLVVEVEEHPLTEVLSAYARLDQGLVRGRAVVRPIQGAGRT